MANTIEGQPAVDSSFGTGRAGQVQPSESAAGMADANREGVKTPEALGSTKDAERHQS